MNILEYDATILDIGENSIEVQLSSEDTFLFPRILFDEDLVSLKFGQAVIYQIAQNYEGRNFQRFVSRKINDSYMSDKKAALMAKLKDI